MTDDMANAVMEAFRALRSDDRIDALPVGSDRRKAAIDGHLVAVAVAWGVSRDALANELAQAIHRNGA